VLNYRRNESLVFDAAGKCILTLYSPEDVTSHGLKGHQAQGKKRSATSDPTVHTKKRRRTEEEDDSDAPTLKKRVQKNKGSSAINESMER